MDTKAIVQRFNYGFLQGKDEQVFDELVHAGFVNYNVPAGSPYAGKKGLLEFMQLMRQAFPDLEVTIHLQIAEGDLVTTYKTFHATHKGTYMEVEATNKRVSFSVMDIIRVKDGQLFEHWGIRDNHALLQQIKAPVA